MSSKTDFYKFATSKAKVSSSVLNDYTQKINNNLILPTNYFSPNIVEERQMNVAIMDVFSRLMADRIIFLNTEIDDSVASVIVAQMLYLSSVNNSDISLYINSPGGEVYSGLSIYDTMQYINCDVNTICTGMAASMASILLCAGTNEKRFALPHSRVMIHQPMGGAHGQASDMEITVNEIKKLKKELYDIISLHSGQSYKWVEKNADRDYWMTAKEALQYNMIDDILIKENA